MSEKAIYKTRVVINIHTKDDKHFTTTSMWNYHYGIPKFGDEPQRYHSFNTCIAAIEHKNEYWPDIFTGSTSFRHRPYIAVCDGTDWECSATKVFELEFLRADRQIETVCVADISLTRLSDILPYKDFIAFAQDHNIPLTLKVD